MVGGFSRKFSYVRFLALRNYWLEWLLDAFIESVLSCTFFRNFSQFGKWSYWSERFRIRKFLWSTRPTKRNFCMIWWLIAFGWPKSIWYAKIVGDYVISFDSLIESCTAVMWWNYVISPTNFTLSTKLIDGNWITTILKVKLLFCQLDCYVRVLKKTFLFVLVIKRK